MAGLGLELGLRLKSKWSVTLVWADESKQTATRRLFELNLLFRNQCQSRNCLLSRLIFRSSYINSSQHWIIVYFSVVFRILVTLTKTASQSKIHNKCVLLEKSISNCNKTRSGDGKRCTRVIRFQQIHDRGSTLFKSMANWFAIEVLPQQYNIFAKGDCHHQTLNKKINKNRKNT